MRKITFYIGLQDKNTKTELIKYDEARKIIANRLNLFTIQQAQGCYKYNDGSLCNENTLIITVFENYSDNYIKVLVNNFKLDFNQECIGVEIVDNCNINFI